MLPLEYQMLTKTYLKPTYLPTYVTVVTVVTEVTVVTVEQVVTVVTVVIDSSDQKTCCRQTTCLTKKI